MNNIKNHFQLLNTDKLSLSKLTNKQKYIALAIGLYMAAFALFYFFRFNITW